MGMKTIYKLDGDGVLPKVLGKRLNKTDPFQVQSPAVDFTSGSNANGYYFEATAGGTRFELSQLSNVVRGYTNPITETLPTEMLDETDSSTTDYTVIPVCTYDNFGPNIAQPASKTSTSNVFQPRRLNNDATVDESLDIRYSWIGGSVSGAALGSDVFVDVASNANGDYVRYYDAGGNDLVVIVQGTLTSHTSSLVTTAYNLEDNFYYPVGSVVANSNSVGPSRFTGVFGTNSVTIGHYANNGGALISSNGYYQIVWIKNTTATYDQLDIGASGNTRYAVFKDSGAVIRRVLQTGVSSTGNSPTVTMPYSLSALPNNTDYRVNLGGTATGAINGSLLEMTTTRTSSAFRIQHKDRNTITSSASYWVADWIKG